MNISMRNYCELFINHEQNCKFKNGKFLDDNQKIIEHFFYSPKNDNIKKQIKVERKNFLFQKISQNVKYVLNIIIIQKKY